MYHIPEFLIVNLIIIMHKNMTHFYNTIPRGIRMAFLKLPRQSVSCFSYDFNAFNYSIKLKLISMQIFKTHRLSIL